MADRSSKGRNSTRAGRKRSSASSSSSSKASFKLKKYSKKPKPRVVTSTKTIATFDVQDRQNYLTGFSKRKKERKEEAFSSLQKKAKENKKATRAELRAALNDESSEVVDPSSAHAQLANNLFKATDDRKTVVTVENDDFTQSKFGADSVVTVTTVALDDQDEAEEAEKTTVKWGTFSGRKGMKIEESEAERQYHELSLRKRQKKEKHLRIAKKKRNLRTAQGKRGGGGKKSKKKKR